MGRVIIVGPRRTQNELLANFFRDNLPVGGEVTAVGSLDEIGRSSGPCICLVDCAGTDPERFESETLRYLSHLDESSSVAMFNVRHDEGIETSLVLLGVRGVFFEGDGVEMIRRGVTALLGGEIWASRMALSRCVSKASSRPKAKSPEETPNLSPRELAVLKFVAESATDEEIAERLFISSATVKTHLYRTFRKIQVNSRLQAALWAAKNL